MSIIDRPARETLAAFADRSLSPVEYATALAARVEASEPHVAALYAYAPERLMAEARASEARYAKGAPMGRLDGMPVTIKELIGTRGDPIPNGTAATELVPMEVDSPAPARLREDGAIIFAKTTCPDYGMLSSGLSSFHHLSRNPWNTAMNPGGSSAGASAAGAAGYGPMHLGTDIGGSVRLPAGWTGLFGFKPSFGRIPLDNYYTGRVAGPMTPTVDDAALMMASVTRPDSRDATSLPWQALDWDVPAAVMKGMRIGLMLDAGCGNDPDPQVVDAVSRAAKWFEAQGAEIIPIGPVLTRDMLDGLDIAWRARFWGTMETLTEEARDSILPYIRTWAESGKDASPVAVARGYDQMFAIRRAAAAGIEGLDAILSPVNPDICYPAEHASPTNDPARPFEHICFTVPWNMGDQPAASINCGFSDSGMPIGLQIVAPRFNDLRVFAMSRAFEADHPMDRAWPRFG